MILFLTFSACEFSSAQISSHRLSAADSLFRAKQYTQSFEQYQTILAQKQYSPAMLLKMAYIQEGLNNIGMAMYYLNLYFLASNDKSVLRKMETMASKYNLGGYDTSDTDTFLSFYHDYHFYISIFLAAACCLVWSVIFYVKTKNRRPIASGVLMAILVIVFLVHINYGERIKTGIVALPNTYIMEGPSAGAPVYEIIDEGHRVEILGPQDVWLKVRWDGETAYIKNTNVLPVEF